MFEYIWDIIKMWYITHITKMWWSHHFLYWAGLGMAIINMILFRMLTNINKDIKKMDDTSRKRIINQLKTTPEVLDDSDINNKPKK